MKLKSFGSVEPDALSQVPETRPASLKVTSTVHLVDIQVLFNQHVESRALRMMDIEA